MYKISFFRKSCLKAAANLRRVEGKVEFRRGLIHKVIVLTLVELEF